MKVIHDYSGPFVPNLRFENLSKKALIKLAKVYSLYALMIHWGWRQVIDEELGEAKEYEMWKENWLRVGPQAAERITKTFNIKERNVIGFFKSLQLDPFFPLGRFVVDYEIKSPNLGIMTVKRCPALLRWEPKGDTKSIELICSDLEKVTFQQYGRFYHPELKMIPMKLPPRQSPDEIACQWEVRI